MNRKYIDDHHVVARYLADQLPDSEREAFEEYYLAHPDMVQEMEGASRFKTGLMRLSEAGELDAPLQSRPWYQQRRYLAVAASLAVFTIGVLGWFGRDHAAQPLLAASSASLLDRLGNPLPIAGTHAILRTRGTSYDAQIELPRTPQVIELRVLPETEAQPPRYRITISSVSEDGTLHEVAAIAGLAAAEDGFVPVYLNSSRLARGNYQVLLSGDTSTSTAGVASAFVVRIADGADR